MSGVSTPPDFPLMVRQAHPRIKYGAGYEREYCALLLRRRRFAINRWASSLQAERRPTRGCLVCRGEGLVGGGSPHNEVAAARMRSAGYAGLRRYPDLPFAGASLDLLYAVRVHPDSCPAAACVAAAGRHGVRPLNADVGLVEVQPPRPA